MCKAKLFVQLCPRLATLLDFQDWGSAAFTIYKILCSPYVPSLHHSLLEHWLSVFLGHWAVFFDQLKELQPGISNCGSINLQKGIIVLIKLIGLVVR